MKVLSRDLKKRCLVLILQEEDRKRMLSEPLCDRKLLRERLSRTRNDWKLLGGSDTLREAGLGEWAKRAETEERRLRAFHEAGHAIIAYDSGRTIDKIVIAPGTGLGGRCSYSSGELDWDTFMDVNNPQYVEKEVLICFAGEAAEALCTGELNWSKSSSDFNDAKQRLENSYVNRGSSVKYEFLEEDETGEEDWLQRVRTLLREIKRLRGIAYQNVLQRRTVIEALAEKLCESQQMEREEFQQFILSFSTD
ncbi:MAG TPA: hypothetical protein VKU00_10400 [Chthonomonadaceae bacterium]|nr:hypothetical protein [Chthonomonadaceae bacterium]